jgi:VanZ family protein
MKKKIHLILTILWICFIFYLSHQPATVSEYQSGGIIDMLSSIPLIDSVITNMMGIGIAEFIIRKSAHMFLYFILAILIYITINKNSDIKTYIMSLVLTALYACTDEFHQLFIEGRSGEIRDVMVDSTGALIGLIMIFLLMKIKNHSKLKD